MAGVDDRFECKQRAVIEYLQYREAPSEIKRKVCLLSVSVYRSIVRRVLSRPNCPAFILVQPHIYSVMFVIVAAAVITLANHVLVVNSVISIPFIRKMVGGCFPSFIKHSPLKPQSA